MKTAKEWVDENTQSGAFDMVENCASAERLVKQIQHDAMLEAARIALQDGYIYAEAMNIHNSITAAANKLLEGTKGEYPFTTSK